MPHFVIEAGHWSVLFGNFVIVETDSTDTNLDGIVNYLLRLYCVFIVDYFWSHDKERNKKKKSQIRSNTRENVSITGIGNSST